MSIRVLIADDEPPARRKLQRHLAAHSEAEVVAEAGDGLEAVEALRRLAVDLAFLDVQMPGLTGLEVVDAVGPEAMPPVVFVTAYDQFAVDAFDVQAVDYLLKPYDEVRFGKAWRRAAARVRSREEEQARLEALLARLRPAGSHLERLVVSDGGKVFLVPVGEVVRLAAAENYVEVHTADAVHLLRDTLAHLEARLDPARFARIHRSEIVCVDQVRALEPASHGDYVVVLRNGARRRLSRRYRERLLGRPAAPGSE